MNARTVASVLAAGERDHPRATALRIDGQSITYADLAKSARLSAGLYQSLGIQRGERVLVLLDNCLEFVYTWLGLALLGALEVPVNTQYFGDLLRHQVRHAEAATLVVGADYLPRLAPLLPNGLGDLRRLIVVGAPLEPPDLPGLELLDFQSNWSAARPATDLPVLDEHDPIAIMYTSGTSGPAKGALISHAHAHTYAAALIPMLELRPGDVYYAPLPLFHIAGQWALVYAALQCGATALIRRRFSASEFWDDVRRENVTTGFLLGAMANFLVRQPPTPLDRQHSLDRLLLVPLVPDLDGFRQRFGVRVTSCYASTEANVPLVADFAVSDTAPGGQPAPGFELAIVDEHDRTLPAGHVGELVVRPREPWTTTLGYWRDPQATVRLYRNAWLHTGDAFRQDQHGAYLFVDRLKDAIRRRGENISSFQVESAANRHPAILESAAIAVPSEHTEDEVGLYAVPKPGNTLEEADLRAFLAAELPRFMQPRYLWIIASLPKTPTGKIQKYLLRDWAKGANHRSG